MGDMFLALRKYADFSGRASRREYWMFQLLNLIISTVIQMISLIPQYISINGTTETSISIALALLSGVISLGLIVPSLAVSVRRLHDIGRSGKLLFLHLIPVGLAIPSAIFAALMFDEANGPFMPIGIVVIGLCIISFLALTIMFFVFDCTEGTPGPNKYGPNPYGYGEETTE